MTSEVDKMKERWCRQCQAVIEPGAYEFNGYCLRCDDIREKIRSEEHAAARIKHNEGDETCQP